MKGIISKIANLKNYHFIIILASCTFLVYSNSLNNSWQFDDANNILDNENVHATDISINALQKSLYHWDYDSFYRPVASLSFALNWYVGRDIVTGYHLVNIIIHIVTASFLYLTILTLLGTPRLSPRFPTESCKQYIAFIATLLWAIHPIQVQAVTYIVQRMTILAAMFSIMGIYVYLKARLGQTRNKWLSYLSVLLLFLLACGSKENSILLPGSIFIFDIMFLQRFSSENSSNKSVLYFTFCLFVSIAAYLVISFLHFDVTSLLYGYDTRFFSVSERLLTEPRVLIFYLSQIFYPLTDRFSIEHDFLISTSFFHPWTTFGAISLIVALLTFCLSCFKKFPILSFSIIFFFYNHIIESTIIPLELVFEHRNYLPSFFLFLPFISGISSIKTRSSKPERLHHILLPITVTFLVVYTLGLGTYTRNLTWLTQKSLMTDAISKAPNKARPYHNLASYLLRNEQSVEEALLLYKLALQKQGEMKFESRFHTLLEIGKIYCLYKNDYKAAIEYYRQAVELKPESLTPRKDLAISLIATGSFDDALKQLDVLLAKREAGYKLQKHETITRAYLLNLQSLIFLKQYKPDMALKASLEALECEPEMKLTFANLGVAYSRTKQYLDADINLQKSLSDQPSHNLLMYLLLLENSIKANFTDKADSYLINIIENYPLKAIFDTLVKLEGNNIFQPADSHLLRSVIKEKLLELGNETNNIFITDFRKL